MSIIDRSDDILPDATFRIPQTPYWYVKNSNDPKNFISLLFWLDFLINDIDTSFVWVNNVCWYI